MKIIIPKIRVTVFPKSYFFPKDRYFLNLYWDKDNDTKFIVKDKAKNGINVKKGHELFHFILFENKEEFILPSPINGKFYSEIFKNQSFMDAGCLGSVVTTDPQQIGNYQIDIIYE